MVVVVGCDFSSPPQPPDAADTRPVVGFLRPDSGADEQVGTTLISVTLDRATDETVTVICAPAGGSADGNDFSVTTNTITFAPGEVEKTLAVTITNDTNDSESEETIDLVLSQPVGAKLGTATTHQIKIADHVLPRVSFAAVTSSTTEGAQTMLVVNLDKPAEGASSVVVGVAGSATPVKDFTIVPNSTIEIPSGATTAMIAIGEQDDILDEDVEDVVFTLKSPSTRLVLASTGLTRNHTINDNDNPPVVGFALAASSVDEGITTATLVVSLSAPSGKIVTVAFARANGGNAEAGDATVTAGTLTFGIEETSKSIEVTIVDDVTDEDNDTLDITLANPTNATLGTTTHALTITDNDNPPAVAFLLAASTASEADNSKTITVTLTPASEKTVSVSFVANATSTATDPADYSLSNPPLTFAAGTVMRSITVDIVDDGNTEGSETVVLDLTNPDNASLGTEAKHTLTITDND